MKLRTIAVALALASTAACAQNVVTGGQLAIAPPTITERTAPEDAFLRVLTGGGGITLMAIEHDGSVTLNYGATISFSSETARSFRRAGPLRYLVPVYVGNELLLLPLYAPVVRPRDEDASEE